MQCDVIGIAEDTRDAEIDDLGIASVVDEDVGGLEIGVDDEVLVSVLNSVADLDHLLDDLAGR